MYFIPLKNHPVEIQKLVEELFKHYKNRSLSSRYDERLNRQASVDHLLYWDMTPQGHSFWNKVDSGDYDKAKKTGHWPKDINLVIDNFEIF